MNRRAVIPAVLTCALLGGWLPSLWLSPAAQEKPLPTLTLPPPPASAARVDWQTAARQARSPLAAFQAVAAGVTEHSRGLLDSVAVGDPGLPEAEELARWLAADAFGRHVRDSAAFLKSLEETDDREASTAALRAWTEASPDAALNALLRTDALSLRGAVNVLRGLAARYPDKALAVLQTVHSGNWLGTAWDTVLEACAARGPDFALAAIQSAPQNARSGPVNFLLKELAGKDPRRALEWQAALPPELHALTAIDAVFQVWADQDPAAAVPEWVARGHGMKGDPGTFYLATKWAEKDPRALFEWALPLGKADGEQAVAVAIDAAAEKDPLTALAMLRRLPPDFLDPDRFQNMLGTAGFQWSRIAPAAALAWARSLPEEQRSDVLDDLIPNLPPEDRRALAAELGTDTDEGFSALLSVDVDEALETFATAPVATRLSVCDELVSRLRENGDHARASQVLASLADAKLDPDGAPAIDERLAGQTVHWATIDPAAAAAWAAQLPAGAAQTTAAANVAFTWGRHDLPAALAWVEQLPAGEAHDKAAEQIARLAKLSGE